MASLFSLNCSLPVQPRSSSSSSQSQQRKLVAETSSFPSSTARSLEPIVVNGDPPTFVSAPGRRIIAGLFPSSLYLLLLALGNLELNFIFMFMFLISFC